MTCRKPDDYESVKEAEEKLSEIMQTDPRQDSEELSDKELKQEMEKFLRGERRTDPRLE